MTIANDVSPTALPVDDYIPTIRARLDTHRALVVTASPGAGKTTRIPPALIDRGPVILLQPRRVAARAIARRIAEERGWALGAEVGWHIRFERRFTSATALLVVTEGILTARLQQDPLLSGFTTVVLDEFHERSIHADLGLALARQAWLARDDLRIVVMSATLDTSPVSRFLDGCPVIDVPGTQHRLDVEYAPGESVVDAVASVLPRTSGRVLCFLPGAREIARAQSDLAAASRASGVPVVPLHGSLDGDTQDLALAEGGGRRIILATNIAETSLTVPGVSAVIDSGLQKVARYHAERGVDSLDLERVTQDSADQRAGRAARLGPGLARRLWDARDRLRPHREPEIERLDLAGPLLELLAWGASPGTFDWFARPRDDRIANAMALLRQLGAVSGEGTHAKITDLGRQMQRLPLHPRLARVLVEGRFSFDAAAACALLSEGTQGAAGAATTSCDLLPAIDEFIRQPAHVRQVARELTREPARLPERDLRRALFTGYADRVARRREGDRYTLATGHGAVLARESGVRDCELIVALDVRAADRAGVSESRVYAASRIEPEWLARGTSTNVEHRFDAATRRVRAARVDRYMHIVLREHPEKPDPIENARLLSEAWLAGAPDDAAARLIARARFANVALDVPSLALAAANGAGSLDDMDLAAHVPYAVSQQINGAAPEMLPLPSGRSARLEYADDGSVSTAVRLQELFGLAETPRLGPRRVPVTFQLLAPNGRPVQTTQDLRNFWNTTYFDVRKELRGRYPKHPWPDDPWTAKATHRAKLRS